MIPTQTVRIPSMMKIQLGTYVRMDLPDDARGFRNLPPSTQTSQAVHLHQTERQDTTESRSDHTEEVEDRVSLAHVVADIPGREKLDAALERSVSKTENMCYTTIAQCSSSVADVFQAKHLQGRSQPQTIPR